MNKFLLITGNDAVAIKYKASKVIEELKEAQQNTLSIETINCEVEKGNPESVLGNLLISINTPSFFSDSKIIWGKHCDFMDKISEPGKNKKIGMLSEEIVGSLEREVKEQTGLSVIFDGPELKSKSALYKFFKKNGDIIECNVITANKETQGKLIEKIKEHCQQENKNIAFAAVQFLSETIGTDSARIFNELNKIIAYAGDKEIIELADCKAVASKSIETANWIFSESLADRNLKASFETLNQVIEKESAEKSASSNIELSMLYNSINKFTELVNARANALKLGLKTACNFPFFKATLEKNADPNNKLASIHPYRAFKIYEQSLKFTNAEYSDIFSHLLDANKEMVSGNANPRIVLENLIVKICGC